MQEIDRFDTKIEFRLVIFSEIGTLFFTIDFRFRINQEKKKLPT